MRRIEIIEGTEAIQKALKECDIAKTFENLFHNFRKGASKLDDSTIAGFLSSLNKYSVHVHNYSNISKEIVKIFGLQELENPIFWAKIISGPEIAGSVFEIVQNIKFVTNNLPKIIELLEPDAFKLFEQEKTKSHKKDKKSLLSVIIIEEKGKLSSPERLKDVLESVMLLYDACSNIMELPNNYLSVAACDSGSDKSFDFLGLAKVVECVKEVILSLWDRVVFYRERKFSQRLALVAESLPIIDRIGEMQAQGKLSPESAELMRRKVTEGASKFLSSGAIIPEIKAHSSFNPRTLMAPEQKLISYSFETSGPDEVVEKEPPHASIAKKIECLGPEDQEALMDLLERAEKKKNMGGPEEIEE